MKTILILALSILLAANCNDDGSEICTADDNKSCVADVGYQATEELNVQSKRNMFECKDLENNCPLWSRMSFDIEGVTMNACDFNSAYMAYNCPESCRTCEQTYLGYRLSEMLDGVLSVNPFCQDTNFQCRQFAGDGECENNPGYMRNFCEASCGYCSETSNKLGVKQKLHKYDPAKEEQIKAQIQKSIEYMRAVRRDRKYKNVRKNCLNKDPECTLWATQDECNNNERFMKSMCAPACMSCDYLGDTSEDCIGLPESQGPLWKPGDLNTFFEEIVDGGIRHDEFYRVFNPKALSRPIKKSDGSIASGVEKDGPWLVLFENFLTDAEADRLVQIGHNQGFQRSTKAIDQGEGQVTEGRTSANTWCQHMCMEDALVKQVLERIAHATKSTVNHSEHLQLLQYQTGQFYWGHDDFIPYQLDMPCGARIMTLFLYLNDVEEGGGTKFSELDITVQPKKGSALLWPNVLDEDPMEKDKRTFHEALPVIKGIKYGGNAWIHSEDFQTPFNLKCI